MLKVEVIILSLFNIMDMIVGVVIHQVNMGPHEIVEQNAKEIKE